MKHCMTSKWVIILCCFVKLSHAQIDLQCGGRDSHSLYLIEAFGSGIYRSDSVDTSPTDAIQVSLPVLTSSLSINQNLNIPGIGESVYVIISGNYHFWNGLNWIDTGHSAGSWTAVNPGGSSSYIFNLDAASGEVYRYDGTANSTLIATGLPTGTSVYDIAVDNQGNFYIFYTGAQKIVAYNPNGIPIDSFNTSGFVNSVSNGMAILGDRIYIIHSNILHEGIKTGNTFQFTAIKTYAEHFMDLASCPGAALPLVQFEQPEFPYFIAFPNPASGILQIKTHNTSYIRMFDGIGRVITFEEVNNRQELLIDVSTLEKGLYYLNAISKDGYMSTKTIAVAKH
jgi:hypothetical protein